MISIDKIKKIISKNYYITGATIGFLIGAFPFVQPFTFKLNDLILFIPRQITLSDYFSFEEALILTPILSASLYTLLGLFIAFLLRKTKSGKKTKKK